MKRPRRVESDDDGAMKKKLIVGGVFVVMLVIGAIIGLKMFAPAGGSGTTASGKKLVGHDAEVLAQIKDEYGTEAKKWLEKNPAHQVMGLSTKQAEYKIDQFYQMGAKQVIAFGNGISTTLAVELPDDPAKRKEIFAWQAKWHKEYGFEVEKDVGQNWLTIKMHI